MSNTPSFDEERMGITEGRDDTEVVVANRLIVALLGQQLVQFRMGYGVHLELGATMTIETPFEVVDGNTHWAGEPLTAEAAGALLPLNVRDVTSARIATDATLVLGPHGRRALDQRWARVGIQERDPRDLVSDDD